MPKEAVVTKIEEPKKNVRSNRVTIELDGETYVFRLPQIPDLWAVWGSVPVATRKKIEEGVSKDRGKQYTAAIQGAKLLDSILIRCSISPKIVAESPKDIPEGVLPIEEMDYHHRTKLTQELLSLSDVDLDKLRPLSTTEPD